MSCGNAAQLAAEDTQGVPQQAAVLAGVSACTIYRRVEREQLHFVETDAVGLLICLTSLVTSISAKENNHVTEHIIGHRNRD